MLKYVICLLALAGCGLPEKDHCSTATDCLGDQVCRDGTCQEPTSGGCGESEAICAPDATCSDVAGALTCTCKAGFVGDGLSCSDVDECAAATSPCAIHASCTNVPASFACACDAEFTGDGMSYCVPAKFTKLAPAGGFTCGLAEDGGIYCWGQNFEGDLGDGTTARRTRPTQVGTATDWIDVDAHTIVGCGLRADHSMWCWGMGNSGELGDGKMMTEHTPTMVISDKPGVGWKSMAIGRQTLCGIHVDGSLACWGRDRVTGNSIAAPVAVDANTDWTEISIGTVLCGIRGAPGHLYCWGESSNGDLGLGLTESQATPAQVGTDTWKHVAVGYYNTCGIRSDNALLCWGNSRVLTALQYGNSPLQIGTATDWQSISLSERGIIGLRAGGNAYAWGGNGVGQLGVALALEIDAPTPLSGTVTGWSEVRSGNVHGCGIAAGQAYCWGDSSGGLLGDGTTTTLYAPTRIGSDRFTALAGGPGTCGLRVDGALMCWGFDIDHGIGFGDTEPVWAPTRLGTDTWSAVAGASGFFAGSACAIRGGKPYCWGDNTYGQLGIGNTTTPLLSPAAVNVPSDSQWKELAVSDHTCGITNDAKLWCWGSNDFGALGTGATSNIPTTAPVAPLAGSWLHVAAAGASLRSMTCAIRLDHTLWCWGQDPNLATPARLVPTQVGSESSWGSLSMAGTGGELTVCAIKLNGTLWCWGARLGNGTEDASETPVQVGASNDWKSVNVGGEVCGITTGGTLWCWGNQGLLGDGVARNDEFVPPVTSPTQIGRDTDWSTVMTDTTPTTTCATKADGSLWCWGFAAAPIPGISTTPVPIR